MSEQSGTPRTDAAIRDFSYRDEAGQLNALYAIDVDFARNLEIKLRLVEAVSAEQKAQLYEQSKELIIANANIAGYRDCIIFLVDTVQLATDKARGVVRPAPEHLEAHEKGEGT